MSFDSILSQIFQPYFYYSVLFLVISFVCIKVLTRYYRFIGRKTKSLLYLVPLFIPLIIMLIFLPSTSIQTTAMQVSTEPPPVTGRAVLTTLVGNGTLPASGGVLVTASNISVLSVTGIVCIIGLAAGAVFAISMILANDRVARKILRVISLSADEHKWLQNSVIQLSNKLGISVPKIGVVEDLRPNAFTIGYGRRASVVFSVGLFNVLSREEIVAVAAHELAHVKNRDFFYKVSASALTAVSFFNPLAYMVSSMGQREREMLADERATELLEKPSLLSNAIAKICKAIQTLPKESKVVSLSSNLLVTSSVIHRLGILSTHPRLDKRLRNISEPKPSHRLNYRNIRLVTCLTFIIFCSAIVISNAMVNVQTDFASSQAKPQNIAVTGYHIVGDSGLSSSGQLTLQSDGAQIISGNADKTTLGDIKNPVICTTINNIAIINTPFLEIQTFKPNNSAFAFP